MHQRDIYIPSMKVLATNHLMGLTLVFLMFYSPFLQLGEGTDGNVGLPQNAPILFLDWAPGCLGLSTITGPVCMAASP